MSWLSIKSRVLEAVERDLAIFDTITVKTIAGTIKLVQISNPVEDGKGPELEHRIRGDRATECHVLCLDCPSCI